MRLLTVAPCVLHVQQQFATMHGKVGLALFVVMTLQLGSGTLRGMGIANRGNKFFGTNYDRLHQVHTCVHIHTLACAVRRAVYVVQLAVWLLLLLRFVNLFV